MAGGLPPDVTLRLIAARNAAAADFRRRAVQAAADRSKRMAAGIITIPSSKPLRPITSQPPSIVRPTPTILTRPPIANPSPDTAAVGSATNNPPPPQPSPQPQPPQPPAKSRPETNRRPPSTGMLIAECPNCFDFFEVAPNELNCKIFRHGVLKATGQPINPHASKADIDALLAADKIYGCGRPFRFDGNTAVVCGYI
jgi:hypothetical protein